MRSKNGWLFTKLPKQFGAYSLHHAEEDGDEFTLIAVKRQGQVYYDSVGAEKIEDAKWVLADARDLEAYASTLEERVGVAYPRDFGHRLPDDLFHEMHGVLAQHFGGKKAARPARPAARVAQPAARVAQPAARVAAPRRALALTPSEKGPCLSERRDPDPDRNALLLAAEHHGWATVSSESAVTVMAHHGEHGAVSASMRNGVLLPGDGENPLDRHGTATTGSRWFTGVLEAARLEIQLADEAHKIARLELAQATKRRTLAELSNSADRKSFS